jgi:hypothetical protein
MHSLLWSNWDWKNFYNDGKFKCKLFKKKLNTHIHPTDAFDF